MIIFPLLEEEIEISTYKTLGHFVTYLFNLILIVEVVIIIVGTYYGMKDNTSQEEKNLKKK